MQETAVVRTGCPSRRYKAKHSEEINTHKLAGGFKLVNGKDYPIYYGK
jgi:hypothetical protein